MKPTTAGIKNPVVLFSVTISITTVLLLFSQHKNHPFPQPSGGGTGTGTGTGMSSPRSFILWLHGLGDSGPANEPLKTIFTSPEFRSTRWSFPSAPSNPVTCNCESVFTYGAIMPSWFDIHEIPVTATSPKDENSVLQAVNKVHSMLDKEIADGTSPNNVFVCGFSQGGALTLASVLLYPKTLGGGAVFSGWVPVNSSLLEQVSANAKRTPILWSHGMADPTVLFEAGQAGPTLLSGAGVSCEFKAYPGLGHSINNEELKSLESWIRSRLQSTS